ncbi:MAG: metal transporter [Spirochaetales bacterium]|jgi:zinc transporter, ZIP family|nr:metal transporter [Spirochaetales bacterium]
MGKILLGIIPLAVLAVFIVLFVSFWSPGIAGESPPVEELAIQRVRFSEGIIEVFVINDGPDPVTIAQVLVNGSYWAFELGGSGTLNRLAKDVVTISYPWLEGDDQHITLVTSNGVTIGTTVSAAVVSPRPTWRFAGSLGLIGFLIGVVPVFLGLLWFPFMRKIEESWYGFFLALTVGLLVFLGVDTLEEAFEASRNVPGSYNGLGVLTIGFFAALLLLFYIGRRRISEGDSNRSNRLLAFGISFGIGVHNLGEGLAVGSAYALGNVSLGGLLVVGFMIHNITEGIPIIAPLSRKREGPAPVAYIGLLGLIAGVPAIAGTWIGGFAYSPFWAVLFLGIGAGAIFQVVAVILSGMIKSKAGGVFDLYHIAGFLTGLAVMYGTGLLVTA